MSEREITTHNWCMCDKRKEGHTCENQVICGDCLISLSTCQHRGEI